MNPYTFIRPALFSLPPELAHAAALRALWAFGRLPHSSPAPTQPLELWDLKFPNRLGAAAGLDKDAIGVRGLSALGFGHIEVGTVTPKPQTGNPKPRLWRLREHQAIINRLGFPGQGACAVATRLRRARPHLNGVVLGVNLGKNAHTPLECAAEDYAEGAARFAPLADYLTLNVSSPNTTGLRNLQAAPSIAAIIRATRQAAQQAQPARHTPLWVKLSPDMPAEDLLATADAALAAGADALVAANTTLSRPLLPPELSTLPGGLSGLPLQPLALRTVEQLASHTSGRVPIIAVGGITTAAHLCSALNAGACLAQVYTAFVYQGPALVRTLTRSPV